MTNQLSIRSTDIPHLLPQLSRFGVGFDSMFNRLEELHRQAAHQSNYPPHNVVKISDDEFFIEVAIAGFLEGEVSVKLDNRTLSIIGNKNEDENSYEYLYKGLSSRDFEKHFTLAEHVEITSATVKNGILKIYLQRQIPEDKKPKTITLDYLN